jgi:pimeloyl-ACP methyl ester carboxylesterase
VSHAAPLAHLKGVSPPAPDWFTHALAMAPERGAVRVDGANIETLAWGKRGNPGLLFVHGYGGGAAWWNYLAPCFAGEYRVAALSLSGMGGSDWRGDYSLDLFMRECFAAADSTGLYAAKAKPVFVAHSFGSLPVLRGGGVHPEKIGLIAAIDPAIFPLPDRPAKPSPFGASRQRFYKNLEEALARFRFVPPQNCDNLFIADYLARVSLKETPEGWTWRFDPKLGASRKREDRAALLAGIRVPLVILAGDRSALMVPETVARIRALAHPGTPWIDIAESGHQVAVDQPLRLVDALREVLKERI